MIVCVCKSVSERQIKACLDAGATSMEDLQIDLGVALCCGKCGPYVQEMVAGATPCCGRSCGGCCQSACDVTTTTTEVVVMQELALAA
ncbi:(2Fe-2S)-binding protein [Pandoraea pneumonica]|uniref:(2Fe-2S)-binding protein n=1 Tax=Pandoraea pneumonica TaxID=2508299 RepID=A0A5E4W7L8_9BURK|nr:(2Fe-2S)-binding protein [Pandoraea pneumonica]VVE19879.1 (2Fe-2S)-binding protein [Pandoraea pneumonica]